MRGPFGLVATFWFLLQLTPASSFGGALLTRTRPLSTATSAVVSSGQTGASKPLGARAGLFSSPARPRRHGRGDGALLAGGGDGVKKEATEAKPAAKKSSVPGGMGGWDWGFTSTSSAKPKTAPAKAKSSTKPKTAPAKAKSSAKPKTAPAEPKSSAKPKPAPAEPKSSAKPKPAPAEPKKPVFSADDEADEIAEIKRKAEKEIKAEQEAEKEKVKAKKKEEEAKFAEAVAARVALRKRAEEMAAIARGDMPKAKPAAATSAKAKTEKPKPKETEAKKKTATAAAEAAAAAKPAAAKVEKEKKEKDKPEKAKVEAAAAKKEAAAAETAAKVEKEKKEKESAEEAKKEAASTEKKAAAAAAAAREKRAEEIAAKARGDVPEPKKKAELKVDAETTDAKTQEATPNEVKAKDDVKKPTEPKKRDAEKPVAKKKGMMWGMAPRAVAAPSSLTLSKPETIVVVTGATGRVGSLAVRRLLELYPKVLVRAIVNDYAKGSRLLKEEKDKYGIKLEIMSAELGGRRSAAKVVEGASAVVFCASGFAQNLSPIQRLANAVRLTINPSSVADVEGVRDVALALKATKKLESKATKAKQDTKASTKDGQDEPQPLSPNAPRFVLLSSAAVTRPNWSSEEKKLYPLAADVPIVKLNPLNILTVKAEGEKELREIGIPYTVVRPCGLNDDHPRGRPLFSVGDTAAGRICREDVADVLVRCLGTPEATGKTFEVQSLPGFEKVAASVKTNNKGSIDQALASLPTDEALKNDPELLQNYRRFSYPVLTQLRPLPLAQTPKEE